MDKHKGTGAGNHRDAQSQKNTAGNSGAFRAGKRTDKEQIKNWINRYNREQARLAAVLPLKDRGRPRKGEASWTPSGLQ